MANEFQHQQMGLHPANKQLDVFAVLTDFKGLFGDVTIVHEPPPCAGYTKPLPKEQANG